MTLRAHQVNLQQHFGGGEVYTAFLCRALDQLGIPTTLYAHADASFWFDMDLPVSTLIERITDPASLIDRLPPTPLWLLGHGPQLQPLLAARKPHWLTTAIAHMPLQGRNPKSFAGHDMVFPVSEWVRTGLLATGTPTWDEPLFGVAALDPKRNSALTSIIKTSRYEWDRRKFRDRLLSYLSPLTQPLVRPVLFSKKEGLTLGIVSRLTPIKQFPLLFTYLAPILARFPAIHIEIFGSGGYASVRDLDRALKPVADRVRFWGHQRDVRAVYAQLDYLLVGLPEKEALGLNVIEAQACNLPVLAVGARPFTETIKDEVSGFFYRDPREDAGADFSRLIERLITLESPLNPAAAHEHLARFSLEAFVQRLSPIVAWAEKKIAA